jgi:hypothetical protein
MSQSVVLSQRTRWMSAACLLFLGVTSEHVAAQGSNDDPAVVGAVDALLRGEPSAADEAWRLSPRQLDLVAQLLMEDWRRFPHEGYRRTAGAEGVGGLWALHSLTRGRPPLPGGAPEALVLEMQRFVLAPKPDYSTGEVLPAGQITTRNMLLEIASAADGPGRAVARFDDMHPTAAAIYASRVAADSWPASWSGKVPSVDWTEADRTAVLAATARMGVALIEDHGREGILYQGYGWEMAPSLLLFAQMDTSQLSEEAVAVVADGLVSISDAMIDAGMDAPPLTSLVAIRGMLGLQRVDGEHNLAGVERQLAALAAVEDASLDAVRLGRIVRLLDGAARNLARLDGAIREQRSRRALPDGTPQPDGPTGVDGVCDALAALVLRIHAIPPSHAAWSEENRCLWIEAVDRDRGGEHEAKCASIAAAWATARAGIDAEWREACTKRAEVDAAERETRRAARQARREAWEARLREGAEKPKDS